MIKIHAKTNEYQAILDILTAEFYADDAIRAAWLSGGYGRGDADEWSDMDFVVCVPDGCNPFEVLEVYRTRIYDLFDMAFHKDLTPKAPILNGITNTWNRFDMHFVTLDDMGHYDRSSLRNVIDKDGIHNQIPNRDQRPSKQDVEGEILWIVQEFVRYCGLLPMLAGRREYAVMVTGLNHTRERLIRLMVIDADRPVSGALCLKRKLSTEHMDIVNNLPLARPDKSIIETEVIYARIFEKIARKVMKKYHLEWPDVFWRATLNHLERAMDIRV